MEEKINPYDIDPEIIVQAFDIETTLEAFEFNQINEFFIKYGGVTDPLGQLASTIMNFIDSVVGKAESAIKAAIDSVYTSLKSAIDGIASKVADIVSGIKSAIQSSINAVQSAIQGISKSLSSIASSILNAIKNVSASISSAISSLSSSIQSAISSIQSAISNIATTVSNTISNFAQSITNTIQSAFSSLQTTISNLIQSIVETIQTTISNVINQIQNLAQSISNTIQTAFQNLVSSIQSMANAIQSAMTTVLQSIQSGFQSFMQQISTAIQGFISQIQNIIQNVVSAVQQGFQNIQTLLTNISQTISSSLQSFAGSIQSMFNTLISEISKFVSEIGSQVGKALQGLYETLKSMFKDFVDTITGSIQALFDFLKDIPTKVSELAAKIPEIPSMVEDKLKPILDPILEKVSEIPQKMKDLAAAFQGFVNPLVSIAQFFEQVRQKVIEFFTGMVDWLTQGWQNLVDFVKSIPEKIGELVDWLKQIGQFIYDSAIKPMLDWFDQNIVSPVTSFFDDVRGWFTDRWNEFVDFIKQIPDSIKLIGKLIYENAFKPLLDWFDKNVKSPLSKFWEEHINKPILEPIRKVFAEFWSALSGVAGKIREWVVMLITDPVSIIKGFAKWLINAVRGALEFVWGAITGFGSWITDKMFGFLSLVASTVYKGFSTVFRKLVSIAYDAFSVPFTYIINFVKDKALAIKDAVKEPLTNVITSLIEPMVKNVGEAMESTIMKVLSKGKHEQVKETITLLGGLASTIILSQYVFRAMAMALHFVATPFDRFSHELLIGWRVKFKGKQGVKFVPVGVGLDAAAEQHGEIEHSQPVRVTINLGATLRHIAKELKQYPDEFGRALMYGWAIWLSQPYSRLANYLFRDTLIIELPTLAELREITRRHIPTGEGFLKHLETMRRYLGLYGYNTEIINWMTTPVTEEGWYVEVTDRFGVKRKIPISLLYELPTPSDVARMMIHDLFSYPERTEQEILQDFMKFMNMRGFNDDIAKFYYLLHYKYPSMDKLWEFSCRVVAKQTWVRVVPKKEGDLGYDGFSPVQLQNKYGFSRFVSEDVENQLNRIVENVLRYYAKWHDYSPFPWLKEWTADNLIYLDLMADIPQRIDARWMYKWKVPLPKSLQELTGSDYFDEKALFLIVTSRGMHPRWIEPITIAECMNALQEERTFARTGVLNMFKEGFMTYNNLEKVLSNLTEIEILGKKVPVRFLEGEVKLLGLRAKYDRALDILRDYFRDLLRAVVENMMPFKSMVDLLKEQVSNIAKSLGLKGAILDESYYELYEPVAGALKKVRTIDRIRYWTRYMLYRLLQRFAEGYMSKEEFDKIINDIIERGKLTDEEKEYFKLIGQFMYDGFYKKTLADGILHKVKRGVLDPEKAVDELVKLGLTKEVAEALIEKNVRLYTLSVTQLISYAEYVDIPEELLKKKLKWLGVPEDEMQILLQVFRIRPIKDERAKMIRSVIDAYIDGYIDKETFKKNLKNLGKSPREIKILEEFADFEKSQARAKLFIDATLNKLRRGAITIEQAKKELEKVVVDKALIDAMIEKYVRTSVWSPDKLVSMAEYVPINIEDLVKKAEMFGYPEEEVKKYPAYVLARNLNEEIGRVVNELVYLYVYDIIDEETLRKEIDKVRTLNGEIKKYGVDWIVIDDLEKELIIQRAKLRKMREKKKT